MNPQLPLLTDLSLPEKLQLVEDLWDHIAQSPEALPVPDWQKQELDKRKTSYEANPSSGVSWSEAKNRIQGRDD
jgi:putative addiction module component (TIGR02574 family)